MMRWASSFFSGIGCGGRRGSVGEVVGMTLYNYELSHVEPSGAQVRVLTISGR
jgi:hypothetical protein